MLYHNHTCRAELEAGAPDWHDPDDQELLVFDDSADPPRIFAFGPGDWRPLFRALEEARHLNAASGLDSRPA